MSGRRWGELWQAGQAGWPMRFPVVQLPNAQLAVALLAIVLERLTHGRAHDDISAVGYVALGAWAIDELLRGVNWFRRALGFVVLVSTVVRLAAALG